jgi:hypothetical protein
MPHSWQCRIRGNAIFMVAPFVVAPHSSKNEELRRELSCMAGKTPDKPRKSVKKAQSQEGASASPKKTQAEQSPSVTPINRDEIAQGGNSVGTNKTESRPTELRVTELRSTEPRPTELRSAELRTTEPAVLEQIRRRAYELFEQRGRAEGFAQEDWARAEAEILARFQRGKSA